MDEADRDRVRAALASNLSLPPHFEGWLVSRLAAVIDAERERIRDADEE